MKVGIKQINKPTPKWIRKLGTVLISAGSAGSALFANFGKTDLCIYFAVGGLIGKAITEIFGE